MFFGGGGDPSRMFDGHIFGYDGGEMEGGNDMYSSFFQPQGQRQSQGPAFRSQSFNVHNQSPNRKRNQQDPPIEHDLYVSLEDIDKGCTKKMKISRMIMGPDGKARKDEKVLNITVKPGWKAGTKITFQREGDVMPGKIPADIVFIIRDKPHPTFKREASDIRYTAKVTLRQALCGVTVRVPTLNADPLTLNTTNEVIKPNTVKRIQGKGLPFPKEPSRRGDLLVAFEIQFPDRVTQATKDILADLFPN